MTEAEMPHNGKRWLLCSENLITFQSIHAL